eukprot:TRINITY_DN1491_c2_g5_i1.p1 TRINITY_DN1491_c2_g5~~TRINITY_DN1491_c2_g5_i1.p1  ORF type:complete len:533 (-),score=130.51 TRINITY_DN1491_c2_g5_i1:110-1708(-)
MLSRIICVTLLAFTTCNAENLVLKPQLTTGKPASLVMVGGAQIANTAYKQMLEHVQAAAAKRGISLWAASPSFLLNTPNPAVLKGGIESAQKALQDAGLPADAPAFFAAHSLGTVFTQAYVHDLGDKVAGQILMGGFILRKNFYPKFDYPVPTLTIGAELDGLARVTRIAESYYHQKDQLDKFPVVVVPGMNHMQFGSGDPPINVRWNDLEPEVEEAQAHEAIGSHTANFLAFRMGLGQALESDQATAEIVDPIVKAYELESSRRFNAPNQVGGPGEKECVRGLCPSSSNWAPEAQKHISGPALKEKSPNLDLDVTNGYVLLAGSPVTGQDFHLSNITVENKKVSISTFSQCYWNDKLEELLEDFDTGFTFTSAQEIGTKLYSRQCTLNVGLGLKTNFSEDDPDFCAETNKMAYAWALEHGPKKSVDRFLKNGILMEMGKDAEKGAGPLWVYARLEMNKKEKDGREIVEIVSPMMKTEQDYWKDKFHVPRPSSIPDPGCYHYCKLLSPARVMEWMMVDGLRVKKKESQELII